VNKWLQAGQTAAGTEQIAQTKNLTEPLLRQYLDQPDMPDPDIIIRTAGEKRTSNFLLWESAYTELYFSPYLWPDWDKEKLIEALQDYQQRERRFGGIKK
jgi:undecaprenyl diphosphate synthase